MPFHSTIKQNPVRLLIWMNMPSHHQAAFFSALRQAGIDLVVHYYGEVPEARKRLGWGDIKDLPPGEIFVQPSLVALEKCPDWRERVHIIPGYGNSFLRKLARYLSKSRTSWMHWSEPSHDGWRWWLTLPLKRWYASILNDHALAALAIGDKARRDFIRWGVEPGKIHLLPYAVAGLSADVGADPDIVRFADQCSIVFVFLGVLCQRKGTDYLLQAFSKVVEKHPAAGLVLVGSDPSNGRYRALAERLKITNSVYFRGSMPADRVNAALKSCHVLVMPSRFDGWGMGLNEAASVGKALIASDACGSAFHLIVPGENGFRVAANDVSGLAAMMFHYADDLELAKRHGSRSREIFRDYTPMRNADRLIRILTAKESCDPAGGGG